MCALKRAHVNHVIPVLHVIEARWLLLGQFLGASTCVVGRGAPFSNSFHTLSTAHPRYNIVRAKTVGQRQVVGVLS